ncbi:hypothetical protein EZS27_032454, partial [termite gut metagenome]
MALKIYRYIFRKDKNHYICIATLSLEIMKRFSVITKFISVAIVVLLCVGLGTFSYIKLRTIERNGDFDLYMLVPPSAVTILDTDNASALIKETDALNSSKDNHTLRIPQLLANLKQYYTFLIKKTPNGLDKPLNKILVSFHEPDNPDNQVFYCRLGGNDSQMMERFIILYGGNSFPFKSFDYKGEEMRIYSMSDGCFLTAYSTQDFFVVSYQKWLVEEVIDAYLSKQSILTDMVFAQVFADKKTSTPTTMYIRTKPIDANPHTENWIEFDVQTNSDAIYLSGVTYNTGGNSTFTDVFGEQTSIIGFPGDAVPASSFFFGRYAASDWHSIFNLAARYDNDTASVARNNKIIYFLEDNALPYITTCLFWAADSIQNTLCSVMNIPIKYTAQIERRWKGLSETLSTDTLQIHTCFYK